MKWVGKQSLFEVEGSSPQLVKWQWIVINKIKCHYTKFHVTKISSKAKNLKWCGKSTKNVSPFYQISLIVVGYAKTQRIIQASWQYRFFLQPLQTLKDLQRMKIFVIIWLNRRRIFPVSIYIFQVNDGSTRTMCEICSKLTIKHWNNFSQWSRSGIFVANFWTNFTHIDGVSSVGFEQVNVGWVLDKILYNLIIWKE